LLLKKDHKYIYPQAEIIVFICVLKKRAKAMQSLSDKLNRQRKSGVSDTERSGLGVLFIAARRAQTFEPSGSLSR